MGDQWGSTNNSFKAFQSGDQLLFQPMLNQNVVSTVCNLEGGSSTAPGVQGNFPPSSSPTINANPSSTDTSRKSAKSRTVGTSDVYRKQREDKSIQLRKEKRQDRTNIERRKFKMDTSKETEKEKAANLHESYLRRVDIIPRKAQLLYSNNVKDQIDGAIYFRRVLAADKSPPLDLIFENGKIVPALVQFLTRFDESKLQLEAAWSITNIACGDIEYIYKLLEFGTIDYLFQIITYGSMNHIVPEDNISGKRAMCSVVVPGMVREQALWALSNISIAEEACEIIGGNIEKMQLILTQMGVLCVPLVVQNPIDQTQEVEFHPRHATLVDNPSLSTMRHVTFICGNILKQPLQSIHISMVRCIMFAFGDLLQSPDDEIILDICQSIGLAATNHPDIIPYLFEVGIISRLKELVVSMSNNALGPSVAEIALLSVISILRLSSHYERKMLILTFQQSAAGAVIASSGSGTMAPHPPSAIAMNTPSSQRFIEILLQALRVNSTLHSNTNLHVWKHEILTALNIYIDLEKRYRHIFIEGFVMNHALWESVEELLKTGAFDLENDIGLFLSLLLPDMLLAVDETVLVKVFGIAVGLYTGSVCGRPLVRLLTISIHLLSFAISHSVRLMRGAVEQMAEKIDRILLFQPSMEVASLAGELEKKIDCYQAHILGDA